MSDQPAKIHDVRGCRRPMELWAESRDGLRAWWCRRCNVVKWDEHPGQVPLFADEEGEVAS